mgnify:CR=1 FL=1
MERNIRDFLSGSQLPYLFFLIFLGLLFGKIISNFASGEGKQGGFVTDFLNYNPDEDGEIDDIFGSNGNEEDNKDSSSEEAQGIEAIEGYEAENLPYTITEEKLHLFFQWK